MCDTVQISDDVVHYMLLDLQNLVLSLIMMIVGPDE